MLALDIHVHIHDPGKAGTVLSAAPANARRAVRAGTGSTPDWRPDADVLVLGIMQTATGPAWDEILEALQSDPLVRHLDAGGEGGAVPCRLEAGPAVVLLPGRQIVTREKLEVLAPFVSRPVVEDRALPLSECVQAVVEHGGVPVLPWSPGKWLFGRGRAIRTLLNSAEGHPVLLSDTKMRPACAPPSPILRRARRAGRLVLAGTDPLPIPGDDVIAGSYLSVHRGRHAQATEMGAAGIRRALLSEPEQWRPCGRRDSLATAVRRWRTHGR